MKKILATLATLSCIIFLPAATKAKVKLEKIGKKEIKQIEEYLRKSQELKKCLEYFQIKKMKPETADKESALLDQCQEIKNSIIKGSSNAINQLVWKMKFKIIFGVICILIIGFILGANIQKRRTTS